MEVCEDLGVQWEAQGFREGLAEGAQRGHDEGFALAKDPARVLGAELGAIAGQACIRLDAVSTDISTSRLRRLLAMIAEFSLTNEEDTSRESNLTRIRALAASLGLRGAAASPPSSQLDF